jgi:hypothetical protein
MPMGFKIPLDTRFRGYDGQGGSTFSRYIAGSSKSAAVVIIVNHQITSTKKSGIGNWNLFGYWLLVLGFWSLCQALNRPSFMAKYFKALLHQDI